MKSKDFSDICIIGGGITFHLPPDYSRHPKLSISIIDKEKRLVCIHQEEIVGFCMQEFIMNQEV